MPLIATVVIGKAFTYWAEKSEDLPVMMILSEPRGIGAEDE